MSVGAEIEAECGRCGRTWHVVIAMVDGRVAQVECGECHRRHRLRTGAAPRPRRAAGAGATRRVAAAAPLVAPDLARAPRPYDARESYQPGDRVEHPAFGPGVVERLLGANKVQVFFSSGSRVLVHRRLA
ncbi:MAG TPA: hypothetical protein VIN04_14635 [Myxococcota bacterium]